MFFQVISTSVFDLFSSDNLFFSVHLCYNTTITQKLLSTLVSSACHDISVLWMHIVYLKIDRKVNRFSIIMVLQIVTITLQLLNKRFNMLLFFIVNCRMNNSIFRLFFVHSFFLSINVFHFVCLRNAVFMLLSRCRIHTRINNFPKMTLLNKIRFV